MEKKKKLFIFLGLLIIVSVVILLFILFKHQEKTFTLEEKQWIDENKNKVIDISILNDIPVLDYNGEGLLFSFLEDFEKEVGLEFNTKAYKIDDKVDNDYTFKLVDKKEKKDLLVLRDNYVLITKEGIYNDTKSISNLRIGVLAEEKENTQKFLNETNELVEFETNTALLTSINEEDKNLDGIITLKTLVMETLIKNDLTVAYQFDNYTKDYVITLNGDKELNNIISKYYNKWEKDNYTDSYNEYLLSHYYEFKNIKDSDKTDVKSKKYTYGFVESGIYDLLSGSKLKGINNLVLKNFSDFSGISIKYKKYSNIKELVSAYNDSKIDIFFNNTIYDNFNNESLITRSGVKDRLVVVSRNDNKVVIDSLQSLNGKTIAIVENSYIEKNIDNLNVEVKEYQNITELLEKSKKDELIIIDLENYTYYKNTELINYKIDYVTDINNNYKYVINNKEKVLADLFDFYINYTSTKEIKSNGYDEIAYKYVNYLYILLVVILVVILAIILVSINKFKKYLAFRKKKRRINLSKADKIKYIDQLTSLKNRAYLNSKVDAWDASEVYPQSIIIVDLNNVSYINDNYGREEGDKVIVEAASILINSQLPNSEIIRTDGNEFLIYLVGYSEKNVIAYLRNLSREMKKLSHGFGAATGYSMINDGIKTIDDAVNEATLDMKNNKEDIEY